VALVFFRKITSRSNGKEYTYLKLIENYREGNKVKQRVIANLGSMDKLTAEKVNGLVEGLTKICGITSQSPNLETKQILRYGEALAIHKLWALLGLDKLIEEAAGLSLDEERLDIPWLVELMVMKQMINSPGQESVSDWCKGLYMSSLEGKEFKTQHFNQALDVIAGCQEELGKRLLAKLTSLLYINTDFAYCLLTAGAFASAAREISNSTAYGSYRLGVNLVLLVSRDGLPLGQHILHETSAGELSSVLDDLKVNFDIDKCIFVGDRRFINEPTLKILAQYNCDYIRGGKFMTQQDLELFSREWPAHKHEFQPFAEAVFFKEIKHGDTRCLLCINPLAAEHDDELARQFSYLRRGDLPEPEIKLAGAFLLETNNNLLKGQEILKAYTDLSTLADSFRQIKPFEPWPNLQHIEQKVSANLCVGLLAIVLEKIMERLMRQAGLSFSARQALLLLEAIKVVIYQIDGQEFKSVTSIAGVQEDILKAIGLNKEQCSLV